MRKPVRAQAKQAKPWLLLAVLPLASGAALLVHVLGGISLSLALLVGGIIIISVGFYTWRDLAPPARAELTRRIKAGLLAGLLGTLVYDFARWVIVTVFHYIF